MNRRGRIALKAIVLTLAAGLFLAGVPANPLPFYIDESSIAYNAVTIAQSGHDEHGVSWPLYFRAFGEYKNPTLIYLLALLFKVLGPGILLARLVSAAGVLLAVVVLGEITEEATGSPLAGSLVVMSGALTPWLFEVSRLVFEVALYPLALILFLRPLHRAAARTAWTWMDAIRLSAALALLTYTYSIGRLLAPLLALGLVLFGRPGRWAGIVRTWCLYVPTLLPLFAFSRTHPGALSARFEEVSVLARSDTWMQAAVRMAGHYFENLSVRRLLLEGDTNVTHHVPGMGSLLAPTAVLALAGVLLLPHRWREPWWRFVVYGLLVSVVPASLTDDPFHTLRLIAFPMFLLLLTGLAWGALLARDGFVNLRRSLVFLSIALTLLQGVAFQRQFHRIGPLRNFDLGYLSVFDAATASAPGRLHLPVGPGRLGYIHAYWYGTLRGMDTSSFVRLEPGDRPPPDALFVGEEEGDPCAGGRIIAQAGSFIACRTAAGPGP